MPTPARIAEIQLECMADDVPPLDEMQSWSETAVTVYFESGGTTRPAEPAPASVSSSAAPPKPRWPPPMPSWLAAEQRVASQAASSIEQAHHSQPVSCVRLWRDEDGSLGARGQLLAVSGSWDCAVRVWRVAVGEEAGEEAAGAAADAAAALATLAVEGAERWVCGMMHHARVALRGDREMTPRLAAGVRRDARVALRRRTRRRLGADGRVGRCDGRERGRDADGRVGRCEGREREVERDGDGDRAHWARERFNNESSGKAQGRLRTRRAAAAAPSLARRPCRPARRATTDV